MRVTKINGAMYADMLACGAQSLYRSRETVNDLNVFPIPDGDTGDNMYMTINAGTVTAEDGSRIADVAAAASHGMLLGARGNSGVILSRIFSGITKGLSDIGEADIEAVSKAMLLGIDEAYRAVPVPVEGTILTVFSDGVRYADSKLGECDGIEGYFDELIGEMKRSLDRTPELLPVLRDAGVVDSGGAGLICIFEGMMDAILGRGTAVGAVGPDPENEGATRPKAIDFSSFGENDVLKFGYCTEFLLRLQASKVDIENFQIGTLSDHLQSVGESVVAFKEGSIVKVHVHTMKPGDILNYCQQFGEFLTLKIENMLLQHNETAAKKPESAAAKPQKRKKYAIVTVASGSGLKETFTSLGVDAVIDGGQSMNPSAEDFIKAFEKVNAETVFVFPNNGNVIMTAQQAAELYTGSCVRVIHSRTVGEGYSAISMLDFSDGDADRVVSEAEEIMSGVVTGMVSKASRDAEKDGVGIHKDDYIGFVGDTVYVDGADGTEVAALLADKLGVDSFGVMLILVGADVAESASASLYSALSARYRGTEIIMIDGGQPIFDYILVLE